MMRWVNEGRLEELLAFVRGNACSDFYDKKYAGCSVDREHFFELPPLTRAELVTTPLPERTFVPQDEIRFAAFTSGTSSQKPLITLFSDVERYYVEPAWGTGVTRPLIIYPPLNKNFGHTFIQQCRQASVPVSAVFADFQNLQNSAIIARLTGCDSVYATPTIAALFAPYAQDAGISGAIRLLALSSETLTAARREELLRLYPNASIANLYASSEIGQFVMGPCPRMIEKGEPFLHLLTDALAAVELIDGELVVTYGLNKAMPLIRYRTGDMFEEVSEGCACGRPGPVLRWSHRTEVDRLRISGVQFDVEEADRVFGRLSRPTSRYQVHFTEAPSGGVDIRIEIEDAALAGSAEAPIIGRAIEAELLDGWKLSADARMRDALSRGLFASFSVVFVPKVSTDSLKAKRFINHVR